MRSSGFRQAEVYNARPWFTVYFHNENVRRFQVPVNDSLRVSSVDGAPLPAEEGPLRLVVPSDGGGARSVRQVDALDVLDAAAIPAR